MTREPGRAPVRIRRHGAYAPGPHCLDQPPRPQGLSGFAAAQGEDQSAARRLVSNVHHRIRVHGSVSFRPTHQTRARREQLMRISCSRTSPRRPRRRFSFFIDFGAACHIPFHSRVTSASDGVSAARQSKAAKNTHTDQCTVGAGPLARSARTARRRRPPASAKEAQIFLFLFAPSPRHARRTIGKWFPIQPGRRASRAARRLVSMTRQASEKEHVMSFEEMAENAKSPGLADRIQVRRKPGSRRHEGRRAMVRGQGSVRDPRSLESPSMAVVRLDEDEKG